MERFTALIGFVVILGIAYAISTDRKAIRGKTVFWGLVLQLVTAVAVLKGTDPSSIPIEFLPKPGLLLNSRTVAEGRFTVTDSFMKKVTKTVK